MDFLVSHAYTQHTIHLDFRRALLVGWIITWNRRMYRLFHLLIHRLNSFGTYAFLTFTAFFKWLSVRFYFLSRLAVDLSFSVCFVVVFPTLENLCVIIRFGNKDFCISHSKRFRFDCTKRIVRTSYIHEVNVLTSNIRWNVRHSTENALKTILTQMPNKIHSFWWWFYLHSPRCMAYIL